MKPIYIGLLLCLTSSNLFSEIQFEGEFVFYLKNNSMNQNIQLRVTQELGLAWTWDVINRQVILAPSAFSDIKNSGETNITWYYDSPTSPGLHKILP